MVATFCSTPHRDERRSHCARYGDDVSDRRYAYPHLVVIAAVILVFTLLMVAIPGSRSQAITPDELTAGLTPGIPTIDMPEGSGIGVWNEVTPDGNVVSGSVCHQDGCGATSPAGGWRGANRLIWNPIGAASWGTYYTNGLYVAGNGQYVLPGESVVRTFGSDATPPPTIAPTTTQAPIATAPGGITGVEAYIINSNGVRCHLTAEDYWDHSRSCVDSSRIQFGLCFQGTGQLGVSGASLGMSVSLDGVVIDSMSYPPAGVNLFSYPSCQRGYVTSWAFDVAEQGRTYRVDVWGRAGGVDLSSSWMLSTPTPRPPSATTVAPSPTGSATTTVAPSTTTSTTVPTVSATTTSTTSTTVPTVSATPSPTTIADGTTAASTATTAPPPPPAGEATIDGEIASLTLSATDTAVTARSGGVVVEVTPSVAPDNDASAPVSANGIIDVTPLQAVEVVSSGFEPDSDIEIWLHSEPMLLARAKADAAGTLRTAVLIPALAPHGHHRLVITGRSPGGEVVSVAMAVRVTGQASAAPPVAIAPPEPGSSSTPTVVISVVITLAVVAGILAARRRFTPRSS